MITQKINIVLFGSGKVGSQLVNKVLYNQELLLQNGIDLRISLVVSSSLVFIEKENIKNAWDVSFIKSTKAQRVFDIVDYLQENNLSNVIFIDATKGFDIIPFYAYFLQNSFDVIAINTAIHTASQSLLSEIKASSDIYNSKFFRFASTSISREEIVELVFEVIVEVSTNKIRAMLANQAG